MTRGLALNGGAAVPAELRSEQVRRAGRLGGMAGRGKTRKTVPDEAVVALPNHDPVGWPEDAPDESGDNPYEEALVDSLSSFKRKRK
jgi:hypothetical protein